MGVVAVLGLWHLLGPWHMLGPHLELESRVSGVNRMMVGEAGKGDWDQDVSDLECHTEGFLCCCK